MCVGGFRCIVSRPVKWGQGGDCYGLAGGPMISPTPVCHVSGPGQKPIRPVIVKDSPPKSNDHRHQPAILSLSRALGFCFIVQIEVKSLAKNAQLCRLDLNIKAWWRFLLGSCDNLTFSVEGFWRVLRFHYLAINLPLDFWQVIANFLKSSPWLPVQLPVLY